MNFLPCRVQDDGSGLAVRVNDQIVLPIPPARVSRYSPYKGKEMVLGMRPEHLFDYQEAGGQATRGSMPWWTSWSQWAWRRWCISSSTARRSALDAIRRPMRRRARCCR